MDIGPILRWCRDNPIGVLLAAAALLALLSFVFPGCASDVESQPGTIMESWVWTAPTIGSAVVGYVWEREVTQGTAVSVETGSIVGEGVTLPQIDEATVRLRVAGYDARGRQGAFSLWSEPFTEPGLPGAPGQPRRVL